MVKTLHSAGMKSSSTSSTTIRRKAISAPDLCFRSVDNATYYRLVADSKRYYRDYTVAANTLNMQHPRVLQLIMIRCATGSRNA
jgi:glycogen operon protein